MIEKQEKPIVGHILKTTPVEFKTEELTPEIQEAIDYFKNSEAEVTFETDIDGDKFFEALGIKKENNFGRMQYRVSALLNLIEKQQKEIENSVSKDKIRETIKIIDDYYRMAKEGEEESKAQGYFDGTNIGRRQAHNTDIYQLKKLLEE